MRAIGTRTQIQAIDRENAAKKVFRQGCQLDYFKSFQNQLLQKIAESQALLERLRGEHEALKRIEQNQMTILQEMNE